MSERRNLSLELRPRRLSEMVGQDKLVASLRNKFKDGSVPVVIMLTGSFGQGKTTIASILGNSFNCEHYTEFGEPCDSCLENEDMFHVITQNCANLRGIDAVRELLDGLHTYPSFGKYRIIILDEMQEMTSQAQQALLKPFEGKDSPNIFIICTSQPSKIDKAIRDRSMVFAIPDLTPKGVQAVIANTMEEAKKRFNIEPRDPAPLLKALNSADVASSRNVVMATEKYLAGEPAEGVVMDVKEAMDIDFYGLFGHIQKGDWDAARLILASAKPSDAAQIKSRLSADLRKKLLASTSGERAALLTAFIRILTINSTPDTGLELSVVIASLYQICHMVSEIKKAKTAGQPVPDIHSMALGSKQLQ